ncbi:hypothetical protein ABGB07_02215 [Micromonosporaceae bacterium B7E4]
MRDELRQHEIATLRLLAEQLADMAKVGGSFALTEALDAVARHVRRLADQVAAGGQSLHDAPGLIPSSPKETSA